MREDQARVQLQAAAEAAALRGSLLFHLDLALALGMEALAEAGVAGDLHAPLLDDQGYGVLALEDGDWPQERAAVRFAVDGRPLVNRRVGSASAGDAALARATRTVAAAQLVPGRQTVVAVPQRTGARPDDPIEAYALALSDAPGDVVLGVHWRVTISGDGTTLIGREPLSRSALVLPSRRDQPPLGVEVSHFGAVPAETHTWLSLKHGIALTVVTLESGLVWTVDAERTILSGQVPG